MDYLYKETVLSFPASSVVLAGGHVVVHHHSTLWVYDHAFTLVAERYLYERVLAVHALGTDQLIVLFHGNKAVQLTQMLEPVCFRVVDGESLDVHGTQAAIWDHTKVSVFNIDGEEIREISFYSLGITNVEHVIFLQNYIPTLLIAWRQEALTRCSLLALDGEEVVEEFDVLDGLIGLRSLGRFVVFLYRNFIQVRFKRELSTLVLGRLPPPPSAAVVFTASESTIGTIALEGPVAFLHEDDLFVVNGDGCVYRLILQCDAKRILSASVVLDGQTTRPSCISQNEDRVVLGSREDATVLYAFRKSMAEDRAGEGIVSDEGKRRSEHHRWNTASLMALSVRQNAGLAGSMCVRQRGDTVFTTTRGLLAAGDTIHFQALEKIKLGIAVERIHTEGETLVIGNSTTAIRYRRDASTGQLCTTQEDPALHHEPFTRAVLEEDACLHVFKNDLCVRVIPGVHSFHISKNLLVYSGTDFLGILSLCMNNKNLFYSKSIYTFEYKIKNDYFCAGEQLEECENVEMPPVSNSFVPERPMDKQEAEEPSGDRPESAKNKRRKRDRRNRPAAKAAALQDPSTSGYVCISEVLVVDKPRPYVLIRTERQLHVYMFRDNALYKMYVPRLLVFDSTRSLFSLGSCVYVKARTPYILFLGCGVSMHRSNCRFTMGTAIGDDLYFIHRRHLLRTRLSDSVDYDSSLITDKLPYEPAQSRKAVEDGEQHSRRQAEEPAHDGPGGDDPNRKATIDDVAENEPFPRFLIYADDAIVVAVAHFVPFTYVPFVPMVHISSGPDGVPVSEPIGREVAPPSGPAVLGRTLRYALELRSASLAFLYAVELEENELVCDLRFLLGFIVVCSSFVEGEEKLVRGRIAVYSITDIVPDPAAPHRCKALRLVAAEATKAPVLSVAAVRGLLAACVGTRLMVYELSGPRGAPDSLTAVGRNEIALLSTSIFVIENLIAVADVHRGLRLFFLRPRDPLRLHLLSQGGPVSCTRHVQGIVRRSGGKDRLTFALLDAAGSIHVYTYSPLYAQSGNGTRLIKRAEIRTGIRSHMSSSASRRGARNSPDLITPYFVAENIVVTLREIPSGRALVLQSAIAHHISLSCGINPRNYLEPEHHVNIDCRGVASERILLELFFLSAEAQAAALEMAGCSWDEAMATMNDAFYN